MASLWLATALTLGCTAAEHRPPGPNESAGPAFEAAPGGAVAAERLQVLRERPLDPASLEEWVPGSQPTLVGFDAQGRVAWRSPDRVQSCGEGVPGLAGLVAPWPALEPVASTPLPDGIEDADEQARALAAWVAARRGEGFVEAPDLIEVLAEQVSGIRAHAPTARLKAPLEGWYLDAVAGETAASFRLVPPDNDRFSVLGRVPNVPMDCEPELRDLPFCADAADPSLHAAALTPDGTHLVMLASMGNGSHCGEDPVRAVAWPLPAEVRSLLRDGEP